MKILVWGIGKTARKNIALLKAEVEILAFIESKPSVKFFDGKAVISPDEHLNYNYDCILVLSIYADEIVKVACEIGITLSKIRVFDSLEFSEFSEYKRNHFHNRLKLFRQQKEKINILCTGISYHNDGIDSAVFPLKTFNFALRAQDLFFDYSIIRYLYEFEKEKLDLKYVLIGLNYYSFEYDFSKSSSQKEIIRYYPEISSAHNMMENQYYPDFVKMEKDRLEAYAWYDSFFEITLPTYSINEEEGLKAASADFNKHYPITLYENKQILDDMISFLEEKGIMIKVLIMPAPSCYTKFCPQIKKDLFKVSLAEVLEKHKKVQVLDYFENYNCDLSDYYHVTHFNEIGARKFTEQLVKDIKW